MNEFGTISIDHDLVTSGRPEVAITSTGCLCCTAGSDLRASLFELHEAARAAGRLPLPRVVVETTGLADPAPVINQLVPGAVPALGLRDHTVARHYRLAGLIATFDAVLGPGTLSRHAECVKQIAFSERILITKTDLLTDGERIERLAAIRDRLSAINGLSTAADLHAPEMRIADVFAPRPYAPQDLGEAVAGWLEELRGTGGGHAVHHQHDGHHHHHHANDDGVRTASVLHDGPVPRGAFVHFMDLVGAVLGPQVLRLKGLVGFDDDPSRPFVLQAVQHVVHPLVQLDAWPSEDRRTRLVAITHGIDPVAIERLFAATCGRRHDEPDASVQETVAAPRVTL